MAWTAPRTWVAAETVTATLMNTHVRDNLDALTTWAAFTPNWTAVTTNPAIGNGTRVGRFISAGKLVHFYITLTMGSTTTFGSGNWILDAPVTAVSSRMFTFQGLANDNSGGLYPVMGVIQSGGTSIDLRTDPTTAGNNLRGVSSTVPFTWATSDVLHLYGTYEAA